jgi:hypothetical protein
VKGVHIYLYITHTYTYTSRAHSHWRACVRGDIAPFVRTHTDLLSHVALAAGRRAENPEAAGGTAGAREEVSTQKYGVILDYY